MLCATDATLERHVGHRHIFAIICAKQTLWLVLLLLHAGETAACKVGTRGGKPGDMSCQALCQPDASACDAEKMIN